MNHPIRDPQVQAEVERETADMLRKNNGVGRIVVEFHFNRSETVGYRVIPFGERRQVTAFRRG
jgi:hypothetical protein